MHFPKSSFLSILLTLAGTNFLYASPVSFHYGDNFSSTSSQVSIDPKKMSESKMFQMQLSPVLNAILKDLQENGFNAKNITKSAMQALSVSTGLFSGDQHGHEVRFGITRTSHAEALETNFHTFSPEFEKNITMETTELIRTEAVFFNELFKIYEKKQTKKSLPMSEWIEREIENFQLRGTSEIFNARNYKKIQEIQRKLPYLLGLFFKASNKNGTLKLQMQLALGLRTSEAPFEQESDPIKLSKFVVPGPTSSLNTDQSPIALIQLEMDSKALEDNNAIIPLEVEFGSFGQFNNGFMETKKVSNLESFVTELTQWTYLKNSVVLRQSDTLPHLKGSVIEYPSVKIDINIKKLYFELYPAGIRKEFSFDVSRRYNQEIIRLINSDLILSVGYGSKERLLLFSGTVGQANDNFTKSVNETIEENINLLKEKVGKIVMKFSIPGWME